MDGESGCEDGADFGEFMTEDGMGEAVYYYS